MEKQITQKRSVHNKHVGGFKKPLAKPQPSKVISIDIETTKDPHDLLYGNIDIFSEELAKRIKEDILANSNFVQFKIEDKLDGTKKCTLSVKILSTERSHFPSIKASSKERPNVKRYITI